MVDMRQTESGLDQAKRSELLRILQSRFENHPERHPDCTWSDVIGQLEQHPDKLRSLYEMEQTGGEPDVFSRDRESGAILFFDFSPESPSGRRSLCYDRAAWLARKVNRPENNAVDMAAGMGVDILTEDQYRALQQLGSFDTRTSSWITTSPEIRQLGGALFCDRRYDTVFVYHNGADSYYAARGFRAALRV